MLGGNGTGCPEEKSRRNCCTVQSFALVTDAACSCVVPSSPNPAPVWGCSVGTNPEAVAGHFQGCLTLKPHSRTHTAFCRAGIPNLHGLLFSAYNEDYGVIPASQGGSVGIERVKALIHCSKANINPSMEGGTEKNTLLFANCLELASASINWKAIFLPVQI